ncbi:MAGa3780 family membrane protein [Mycoplasma hafezii]|uniref:MAGa3780 family membrane protein n=1 Tax=Mycoplasma hafezii TaxID=525886 RepID=UPI003CF576DB
MINFWYKLNKVRKATLIAGLSFLIILLISFLLSWVEDSKEIQNSLLKQPENNNLTELLNDHLLFNVKAKLWHRSWTFTYLSNFTVGIALVLFACFYETKWINRLVTWSSIYISVTFLIFWSLIFPGLFLAGQYNTGRVIASVNTHFINPVIALVMVFFNRQKLEYTKRWILLSIIPMFMYYFFAMTIFFIGNPAVKELRKLTPSIPLWKLQDEAGLTIYPFLNFEFPLFYHGDKIALKVVFNLLIVLVGVVLPIGIGFLLKLICKTKRKVYEKQTKN